MTAGAFLNYFLRGNSLEGLAASEYGQFGAESQKRFRDLARGVTSMADHL